MAKNDGYAVSHEDLTDAGISFHHVAEQFNYCQPPPPLHPFALSVVGEFCRHTHERIRAEVEQQLQYGQAEAKAIGEKFGKTAYSYVEPESANVKNLLDVAGMVGGRPQPDLHLPHDGRDTPTGGVDRSPVIPLGLLSGTLAFVEARIKHLAVKEFTANPAAKSQATLRALIGARNFSIAVGAAATLWGATVIPSDDNVGRTVDDWSRLAQALARIFGSDFDGTERALAEVGWSGAARDSADGRITEFVAAGIHLTQMSARVSRGLNDLMEAMDDLHGKVLDAALLMLAAIMAAGAAAAIWPTLRPVVEGMGSKLTMVIVSAASLVSLLYAVGVSKVALAGVDDPLRVGGHEVRGFRRS
ncbi:hypothetical protein [Nonomuraea sediminis]|uniref:hypothetical protein n=1 Tax=Nonomuraea sediminis TaxID=2835864 RepID=UPI001BDD6CD4|nr:hypothetical protein [Nonomuraea sediminis]